MTPSLSLSSSNWKYIHLVKLTSVRNFRLRALLTSTYIFYAISCQLGRFVINFQVTFWQIYLEGTTQYSGKSTYMEIKHVKMCKCLKAKKHSSKLNLFFKGASVDTHLLPISQIFFWYKKTNKKCTYFPIKPWKQVFQPRHFVGSQRLIFGRFFVFTTYH